jgi:lipopolysaccharide transport system ATP-binding protein
MSSDEIAIKVKGLGKKFLVPQRHEKDFSQAPTWREKLKEFFPHLLGADDTDVFWALRDVSFEVRRGEVMGIVGENGSGKSTLLKILSGITPPTEGTAELRGRVGSLLEVGTGFHPDLTGRENIFLNGALLGARTADIRAKLSDIIAFSGIGEFIDVPVKRYSSGMYVRLAYSVTSLLDSDILILDEVLAVGDDAFREKSQAHMRSVTHVGKKTILFVSHNPRAVADV